VEGLNAEVESEVEAGSTRPSASSLQRHTIEAVLLIALPHNGPMY